MHVMYTHYVLHMYIKYIYTCIMYTHSLYTHTHTQCMYVVLHPRMQAPKRQRSCFFTTVTPGFRRVSGI